MSFPLLKLQQVLAAKPPLVGSSKSIGNVIALSPTTVTVATLDGIKEATTSNLLDIGQRVIVDGGVASAMQDINTVVSV